MFGPRINPPSLTQWTETHLKAIYNAVSEEVFDNAFDAFIAKHVHIDVNGRYVSREQYKQILRFQKKFELDAAPAQLSFKGVIEVPANREDPTAAGTIGVMYTAMVISSDLGVSEPQTSYTLNSSLNVTVNQDESLTPTIGFFDPRRVTRLSEVVTHEQFTIIAQHSETASATPSAATRGPPAVIAHA